MRRFPALIFWIAFVGGSCTYNSLEEVVDCTAEPVILQVVSITSADCGVANGQLVMQADGGEGPFSFQINENIPQESGTFDGLTAGLYNVDVVDFNGCVASTEIDVPSVGGFSASSVTSPSGCGISQGSIVIDAGSGVPPYTYMLNNNPPQEGNTFSGLNQGLYEITVTDDTGCEFELETRVFSGITYSGTISDIISTNCAVTGCHAGNQPPDFRVLANIQANAARIKTRTGNREMPAGGRTLTQAQIDQIACWVDDGTPDN